ncbi:MAG: hypothetical protein JRF63_12430, partial [Deltaproteobacteria bacterium]|nr:hypothetical protein [Deltaproteobacteria bacterium]
MVAVTRAPQIWRDEQDDKVLQVAKTGVLARVLGQVDGFVEVQTLPAAEKGVPCRPELHHGVYSLRGFARIDDLLLVLTSDLELEYEDGSSIELAAGVTLESRLDGFRPMLEGLYFDTALTLPADKIARWFHASGTNFKPAKNLVITSERNHWLVDDVNVYLEIVDTPGRLRVKKKEHGIYVLENQCMQIVFSLNEHPPDQGSIGLGNLGNIGHGGGGGGSGSCRSGHGPPNWKIKRGIAVTWPDGAPAGEVAFTHTYPCFDPKLEGDRVCFAPRSSNGGPICFEEAKLARVGGFVPPPLVVKAREPDVRGELPVAMVHRIARRHIAEIRFCGEEHEKDSRDLLNGRVTIKAVVTQKGVVKTAAIAGSTLLGAQLHECIKA